MKYLRYEICALALAAAVLTGAMQLEAGAPTTRPAKVKKSDAAAAAPKIYYSLSGLLAMIPKELTEGAGEELSPSQCTAINQWLTENIPSGSTLALTGRVAGSSAGEKKGVTLSFKHTSISIRGKKLGLQVSADLDGKFAKEAARLSPGPASKDSGVGEKKSGAASESGGASIVVHGKIAKLAIEDGDLRVSVREGGIGGIPSSAQGTTKRKTAARPTRKTTAGPARKTTARPTRKSASKPTLEPTTQPMTQTPEQKAGSQLKLAWMYLASKKNEKAIEVLNKIVSDYPETDAAKKATSKLKKLQDLQ